MKTNLVSKLDKIYDRVQGLCLYCVRHKTLGESKVKCGSHLATGAMVYV
jgi:hypothetical protein